MKNLVFALLLLATAAQARNQPSVLLFNHDNNAVVLGKNIERQRPLASITKLMTAMVSLDQDADLNRRITRSGKQSISRHQAFDLLLIRSDNSMAELLSQDYPGGRAAFIADMNRKARRLGMKDTNFADPSGISNNNVSSALDIHIMLKAALDYAVITEISPTKQKLIEVQGSRRSHKTTIRNTNHRLLFEFDTAQVSKTGFTSAAGRCIAMIIERDGQRFSVVVLGTHSVEQRTRTVEDLIYKHIPL
jgi:D-alanyl-D-alanine endopeptidase (penicillin-binding protein 7)